MKRIAKYEKVSLEQFKEAWLKNFPDTENVEDIYSSIQLPKRATSGSAGYDFFAPTNIDLPHGKSVLIPTGIRARIDDGWVLKIYPRSGLGFKHRIQLDNTVGIIDADYYNSSNEGHIMIKLTNDSNKESNTVVTLEAGKGFAQGIFLEFGITEDDEASGVRDGGFGSTSE